MKTPEEIKKGLGYCARTGYTHCLMDKQFVLDALREKLERDYYGRT